MNAMMLELQQVAAKKIAEIALQQAQGSPTLAASMLGLTQHEFESCLVGAGQSGHPVISRPASLH